MKFLAKKNNHRGVTFNVIAFFIFLHFEIGVFFGFHLTIGAVLGLFLILRLGKLKLSNTAIYMILVILSLVLITPIFNSRYFDSTDFLTSSLLFTSALFIYSLGFIGFKEPESVNSIKKGLEISFLIIVAYSVIQLAASTIFRFFLYNPWGQFQYLYQYSPIASSIGLIRSSGFYLEPSFNAYIILALTISLIILGSHERRQLALSLLALLCTQSATGLIVWFIMAFAVVIKNRGRDFLGFIVFIGLAALVASGYLGQRVNSIALEGSSGHYRVLSPLRILGDLLSSSFFGYPIGSVYKVVGDYQLFQFGSEFSVSLDNGLYVLIFYFGWLGLISIAAFTVWALLGGSTPSERVNLDRRTLNIWILTSLFFSGAIFALEFSMVTWLTLATYQLQKVKQTNVK